MKSIIKRFWWVGLIVVVVGLLVTWVVMSFIVHPKQSNGGPKVSDTTGGGTSTVYENVDPNNLPKFIQADFIDLSKVFSISRFRSGAGHDFSDGSMKSCSSMKHYYGPQGDAFTHKDSNGLTPPPDGSTDTNIFSPVDGTITQITSERTPIGRQIYIRPDSHPGFTIRLFHIYTVPGIEVNSKVKAGQKIGVIGRWATTDISVEYATKTGKGNRFVSYFDVMPDSVFAAYLARGATSRDNFIITQGYREVNPLQCESEQAGGNFINDTRDDNTKQLEDNYNLSGYVPGVKKI